MSLLSREQLLVGLAPDCLSAYRLSGGWRPRILEHRTSGLAVSHPPWLAGLESLEILLDTPPWGGRPTTIVLSSHYVHYALLPPGPRLAARDQTALAHLLFRNLYGELAHDWALRVSPGGPAGAVASGVPQALISDLTKACQGRSALDSLQPSLMPVVRHARHRLAGRDGLLALVEPRRLTLALLAGGQWRAIGSRAGNAGQLPELASEFCTLHGLSAGGRLWLADLTGQAPWPATPGWEGETLFANATCLAAWGLP